MKRSAMALVSILATLAFAVPAIAQDANPAAPQAATNGGVLGTVVKGNKTILFAPAGSRGIDAERLQTWNGFAEAHPKVASMLARKPSLINNDHYLAKHPELSAFFAAHPDIKEAMAENPGNFVAIPPRPGE